MPVIDSDPETVDDLRLWIAGRVGVRPPSAQFGKYALNSIHAYLTGEFIVKPGLITSEQAPTSREMRKTVAKTAGMTIIEDGDVDDEEEDEDYTPYDPGDEVNYPSGRPYRKRHLKRLHRKINATEDQRPYAQGDV